MPKVALLFPCFRTKASTEMLFLPLGLPACQLSYTNWILRHRHSRNILIDG
jgi:hypothetical protein